MPAQTVSILATMVAPTSTIAILPTGVSNSATTRSFRANRPGIFCAVRGFTTISESFKSDPQGLTKLINRFLTPLTNEIINVNGTIDKYMGDCIMAFWNAPIDVDGHEKMA